MDNKQRGAPPQLDDGAVCAECGAHGAVAFDGIRLCVRCYAEKGACCAGDRLPEEPKDAV